MEKKISNEVVAGAATLVIAGTLGGTITVGHKIRESVIADAPAGILKGEDSVPAINKQAIADIVADKEEAWDRLQAMKQWIAEVEELAKQKRESKNAAWQDRLGTRAATGKER